MMKVIRRGVMPLMLALALTVSACASGPALVEKAVTKTQEGVKTLQAINDAEAQLGLTAVCGINVRNWLNMPSERKQRAVLTLCDADDEKAFRLQAPLQ